MEYCHQSRQSSWTQAKAATSAGALATALTLMMPEIGGELAPIARAVVGGAALHAAHLRLAVPRGGDVAPTPEAGAPVGVLGDDLNPSHAGNQSMLVHEVPPILA